MKYSKKTLHSSPERARYGVSFVSSKGNILCRLIKIELFKIFAIINRAIKGLHCMSVCWFPAPVSMDAIDNMVAHSMAEGNTDEELSDTDDPDLLVRPAPGPGTLFIIKNVFPCIGMPIIKIALRKGSRMDYNINKTQGGVTYSYFRHHLLHSYVLLAQSSTMIVVNYHGLVLAHTCSICNMIHLELSIK